MVIEDQGPSRLQLEPVFEPLPPQDLIPFGCGVVPKDCLFTRDALQGQDYAHGAASVSSRVRSLSWGALTTSVIIIPPDLLDPAVGIRWMLELDDRKQLF